jgi:hypothetical protein
MRFHAKFPWPQLFLSLIWGALSYLWIHKPHVSSGLQDFYFVVGVLQLFLGAWVVVGHFFTYWDLGSDVLTERRLWNTRCVPYEKIISVGPLGNNNPSSNHLDIEYGKLGSAFEPLTKIIANPEDRDVFLSALRRRALQAEFSV